ncbi:TrmH family RNA methyltransferase [Motilibacter rhizosphaerae]|uniref:TrmH family RNA methyltransferase n=1 Tax=Motilibacter rhizosphaerae TaxID=598652 RepID=A0A4Q7NR39_9ACTN|nr:RNA methyltransferase [Motilibacter rhizosphaerae]RZS89354.1 TrmH family RNA methyltransferase [Motilibacter rhizosphaerae]
MSQPRPRDAGGGTSLVTSSRNPRVAAARRCAKRSFREQDRRFLAEGPQAVREALACTPSLVSSVLVTDELAGREPELLAAASAAGADVVRVAGDVLAELAGTVTPQGVVAVCGFLDVPLGSLLAGSPRLVAVLSNVRDPGNAGTVLRAADAAGADGVVLTDASVDVYNGKAVRATAGSLFHLPVALGAPLAELAQQARAAGLRVVAADGKGRPLPEAEAAGDLGLPTAWVFGNEAWGLPDDALALCDDVVRLPIYGRAESLNLATAAAVCLYASARAQRA